MGSLAGLGWWDLGDGDDCSSPHAGAAAVATITRTVRITCLLGLLYGPAMVAAIPL